MRIEMVAASFIKSIDNAIGQRPKGKLPFSGFYLRLPCFIAVILLLYQTPVLGVWLTPKHHNDYNSAWTNPQYAYDGDAGANNYAQEVAAIMGYNHFLAFSFDTTFYCDQIRVCCDYDAGFTDFIDVDVHNGSGWNHGFEAATDNDIWKSFSITAVTGADSIRFRFHFFNPAYMWWLLEINAWAGVPPAPPTVQTNAATSVYTTSVILHGQIVSDGGEPDSVCFQYGLTTAYGTTSSWVSDLKQAGQTFGQSITGLTNSTTYHYRAKAKNKTGTGYGSDNTFGTGEVSAGWISPTGYTDPDSRWNLENNVIDDEVLTSAWSYHAINDGDLWTHFLELNLPAGTLCDSVRWYATFGGYIDQADVDVYYGGAWYDVYQGPFSNKAYYARYFAQQTITKARIRLSVSGAGCGMNWDLYEFDFHKISVTPPTLGWTGEANYGSSGVYPTTGYNTTTFIFRVLYTQAENNGPSFIRLTIDKNGDGDYADAGEVIDLSVASDAAAQYKDGTYSNGEIYSTSLTFPYSATSSNISYKFSANDGIFDATGTPTTAVNYPDVILNPAEPSPVWSRNSMGVINGGASTLSTLYAGTGASTNNLVAINLTNGSNRWTASMSGNSINMPTYGYNGTQYLIVASAGYYVFGRNEDGSQLFAGQNLGGTAGNPYVSIDNASFFLVYADSIGKRTLSNGNRVWATKVANASPTADIAVFSDAVYMATTDGYVKKFDLDGTLLNTSVSLGAGITLPILADNSTLYITPGSSNLYALNSSNLSVKWGSPVALAAANTGAAITPFNYPDVSTGKIFVACGSNIQKITDNGASGMVTWTYSAGGTILSGPLVINTIVYFGRNGGQYYAIKDNGASASLTGKWPFTAAANDATSGPWCDQTHIIFGTTGGNIDMFNLE
jgi:hypothetical protein